MRDYSGHNAQIVKVKLKSFTEQQAKPMIATMLKNVAQKLVSAIDNGFVMPDGTTQYPVHSANLRDATGVGVYMDGLCTSFVPTKLAVGAQSHAGQKGIWGHTMLIDALNLGATRYAKGVWIVLFSSVPYAYKIQYNGSKIGRGVGFFDTFADTLLQEVLNGLKPITA